MCAREYLMSANESMVLHDPPAIPCFVCGLLILETIPYSTIGLYYLIQMCLNSYTIENEILCCFVIKTIFLNALAHGKIVYKINDLQQMSQLYLLCKIQTIFNP